jgi:hypothetical protein
MRQAAKRRFERAFGRISVPLYTVYVTLADPGAWRFFPRWRRSFRSSPLADGVPWIPFRATEWLSSYLQSDMTVFEYGSGGSTLFFAERVQTLVSVEHDPQWHSKVASRLRERGVNNVSYLLCEPRKDGEPILDGYRHDFPGVSFADYVKSIDAYPDGSLDLVLVDGRARVACMARALPKIRPGGYLVLDNASDPDWAGCLEVMTPYGYPRRDFYSIAPYAPGRWRTSAWQIPDKVALNNSCGRAAIGPTHHSGLRT